MEATIYIQYPEYVLLALIAYLQAYLRVEKQHAMIDLRAWTSIDFVRMSLTSIFDVTTSVLSYHIKQSFGY